MLEASYELSQFDWMQGTRQIQFQGVAGVHFWLLWQREEKALLSPWEGAREEACQGLRMAQTVGSIPGLCRVSLAPSSGQLGEPWCRDRLCVGPEHPAVRRGDRAISPQHLQVQTVRKSVFPELVASNTNFARSSMKGACCGSRNLENYICSM